MCKKEGCIKVVNNKNYGGYCYKHRREHLVDTGSKRINLENWTDKCSDYLKEDIIHSILYFTKKLPIDQGCPTWNKKDLFLLLSEEIKKLKKYDSDDIQKIIKIQGKFKSRRVNVLNNLRETVIKIKQNVTMILIFIHMIHFLTSKKSISSHTSIIVDLSGFLI